MPDKMEATTVRLESIQMAALRAAAELDRQPMADVIRLAIAGYLDARLRTDRKFAEEVRAIAETAFAQEVAQLRGVLGDFPEPPNPFAPGQPA